jgi:hypothetical protein
VISNQVDATLIDRSLADVGKHEPRLGVFFVSFIDTVCAYMLSFGIVSVTIAWVVLRRGHWWAFWTLVVSSLVVLPYYALIAVTYASFGVSLNDLYRPFSPVVLLVAAATAPGWWGLRRAHRHVPAAARVAVVFGEHNQGAVWPGAISSHPVPRVGLAVSDRGSRSAWFLARP